MPIITIGSNDFIRGESSTDYIADRGFSPASTQTNLTKKRGVLMFNEAPTDIGDTTLTGNIIATANDSNYLGNDKYFLDDEGAFYTLDDDTFTKRQTSASTFVLGTSDLIQFNLTTYATSTDSLHVLTGSDLADCERLWGVGLDSTFRHPMEVIEDELFVGNKNVIVSLTTAGASSAAFTLPPQTNVTSLRKHPDGRTLLAFTGTTGDLNGSHSRAGKGYVYYCDPSLKDWTREVEIESQVEGTRLVGGVIYATWGKNFGFFDGSGLKVIDRFDTSDTTYSHNISNVEDHLIIRDGLNMYAYGDLGAGRARWKMYDNFTNANAINCISNQGGNRPLIAFQGASAGTGLLHRIDIDNSGASGNFKSNRYWFDDHTVIDRIEVIHDVTNASGTTTFTLYHRDDQDTENLIETVSYVNQATTETRVDCNVRVNGNFQLLLDTSTTDSDFGIRQIRIYWHTSK